MTGSSANYNFFEKLVCLNALTKSFRSHKLVFYLLESNMDTRSLAGADERVRIF